MYFEEKKIYHVYNQGNNRCNIFFKRDNYLFFLRKLKLHFAPFTDVLAWCLMPNHFHLMVFIKPDSETRGFSDTMTQSHRINAPKNTLNNSIAIMLRSYTRAINKQEKRSGSLFKSHTKAICVNCHKGLAPSYLYKEGITYSKSLNPELQYPNIVFNYIHQNPVNANLVSNAIDWEFSSAKDYGGLREGDLVNKELAKELGLTLES